MRFAHLPHSESLPSALFNMLSYHLVNPISATFSSESDAFPKLLASLVVLFAHSVAPASLCAVPTVLNTLLDTLPPNAQKSNRSSTHHTGSFSIASFLPSSFRYLYASRSLPSFVHMSFASIARLSNGFVLPLITAVAFANADDGTFAIVSAGLGKF